MTILLGLHITSTILVICDKENKWVGFTKIKLSRSKDCTNLINGRCSFILIIKKDKNILVKFENAYELLTEADALH